MPQAQQVIDDITVEAKNFNRIYVASIHQDLTQDDIKSVFEAFGTITSCELAMTSVPNRHKGYCFIEYGTSQAATDAISSMNLFDLGGQYLRVGRAITPPDTKNHGPPSAVPQVMPTAAAVAAAAATAKIQAMDAVATNLGLKASDIVVSKPPEITARPTPPISSIPPPPLPPLPSEPPAGYAAVPPPQIVTFAPTSLGQSVPQPSLPPLPMGSEPPPPLPPSLPPTTHNPAEMLAKVEAAAQKKQQEELQKKLMEGQEPSTLQQQENMSIKGQSARHLVMQKLMRTQSESVVTVLRNMVTPEEVDEELQEEISDECSKYGEVERVIIYQERQSEDDDAEVIVKIFVEFKESKAAKGAKAALNGRFFGGRIVSADIYDQDLYDHNDFSG